MLKTTVPAKPFNSIYRIPTATGYVVINGEQITKIVATRLSAPDDIWEVTFYLSDGTKQEIATPSWTRKFVHETFDVDKK